ncbi:GPI alpha-1,4-mannosyltransferase I, stabilizing subunit-like [Mytilus galloprovincialis]|uniref:GPI alpha-1,4-mannosyltransferase I, stabilizing subunit-like n=1 Tax=Mytilus galloprovincialis TaxID=29158 RepID=UPI003F7B88BE
MFTTVENLIVIFLLVCFETSIALQLPTLQRKLLKDGFHRELQTKVEIPLSLFTKREGMQCRCLYKEFLPSSTYVDTFQLKSVSKHLGFDYVSPTLDIEKPEFQENTFSIYSILIYTELHINSDSVISNVTFPIHLRYHLPATDYRNFSIMNPGVLIQCKNANYIGEILRTEQIPCSPKEDILCEWNLIKYSSNVNELRVEVPVGNTNHTVLVVIGTLTVTFGSCLWIVYKVFNTKIKQS